MSKRRVLNATSLIATAIIFCFALVFIQVGRAKLMSPAARVMSPAPGLSGTKTIPGDYATLTAAIADIQTVGVSGPLLLELQAGYTSGAETFPLAFTNLTGASAVNTITVRPASGATGLAITSANLTATIDLNNANFVTLDGRPGGVGTTKQLTVENTNAASVALRFINEASNNTVEYVAFKGVTIGSGGPSGIGTVFFSTTTGVNGNDNNTIDHCDIGDGASTPNIGVYSFGSTGTTAQNNSGNTVSNCNIFNYYSTSTLAGLGVFVDGGNTAWTLTGNSLYQTTPRAANALTVYGILLLGGDGYTITNNSIGGSAPSAGGAAWTTTGTTLAHRFIGIQLIVGTTTPTSVQGNTIKNFIWTSSSNASTVPGVWSGIYVSGGSANVGTVTGNTIGSGTGTGSISVTTSGSSGTSFGIGSASSGTVAISNNSIGSLTTSGSTTSVPASLVGIHVAAGTNSVSNNTVGSTSTANSLNAANVADLSGQNVIGILSSSAVSATITGNTVANLNNSSNSSGYVHGIETSAGVNTITGNTVRNLFTTGRIGTGTFQSVIGISQYSAAAGQTVSQNIVHSLAATTTSFVNGSGIYFAGPTSGQNIIARNLVHSVTLPSASPSSALYGMQFEGGSFTAQNNIVRVGLKSDGASASGACGVTGIFDNGTSAGRNFYHNSVYVGGTQTSDSSSTFAFTSIGANNARGFQNNIFVNARSNAGATSKHYAVNYGGSTGLMGNSNIFFVSGTGGVLGLYSGADQSTLAAWQAATGQDVSSAFVNPLFVNPTGDATAVDLHLQANNPAEMGGLPVASVTDDFDGETRSGLTPTDIGADAGNFTSPSGDIYSPFISYTPLTKSTPAASRTLTGFATIIDNLAVSGGTNSPRIYFKKSTDADVFGGNTSADNGWKYGAAGNATSPYDFTIDYSIINGGSVAAGDTIQYFVVAQDAANNFSSSPLSAGSSGNPPVPNINAHGAVNSYFILRAATPINTVGGGGDYPSLTGSGGVFEAISALGLTGDAVIRIISDLTEDGSYALNQWSETGAGNYTVTIQPDAATMRTISGNVGAGGMIRLDGADRVTIDGRFSGAGQWLTFSNTSTAQPTLAFSNDATNNTVKYVALKGVTTSATNGTVVFSATSGANGNDNNTIDHCDIGDGATTPSNGIFSSGSTGTTAQNNSGNTISNCNVFNFYFNGATSGVLLAGGNTDWTLTGNSFYQTASRAALVAGTVAISINNVSGNNFTVTGNFIGGSAPNAGGTPWTTTGTAAQYRFVGIQLNVGTTTPSSVHGNTISNIVWTSSFAGAVLPGVWNGINVQAGSVNIGTTTGNIIGSGTGTGSISVTTAGSGGTSFGIATAGLGTRVIANNTLGSITVNGTAATISASLVGVQVTAGENIISNNIVGSTATANSLNAATSSSGTTLGQHVAGILSSSAVSANITGNTVANLNNNYAGTASGVPTGTAAQIRGIVTSAGVNTITGNTVRNLSTTSQNNNATTTQSVYGIIDTSTVAGQTVSQNTVHSLANTAAVANDSVTGIYFAGPTSGANVIARNFVHSLAVSSISSVSVVNGMQFVAGTFTSQNNIVRVGLKADGASTAGAATVRGIYDNGADAGRNFYHNSVYLGGTQTSLAANTFAFTGITGVSNVRTYKNNIFVNTRSNAGGTGKHYAVQYGGTTVNPTGLTAGGNIFFTSGTGGVLGLYNSADRTTLGLWQVATGQDTSSAFVDPLFVNPTGDAGSVPATAVDLHLQVSNPAEGGGTPLAAVTDDFDGQTRSGLTPVDIGADAGNFTVSADLFAPGISYPALSSGSTANRTLGGFAIITDNVAVSGGANSPRLYFKKSTDADVFGGNTSADNGWKYVAATNASSPYSFTIDYSILNGGSVAIGDAIQYFVVAQDAANNLASSPVGATSSTNPPVQNINAHGAVNSYNIVATLSGGTKTVCASGCDYVSLTAALASGGIFADINAKVVTGNIVINITGDLAEDGTNGLNQIATDDPMSTFTITVQPDSATMRTISGGVNTSLIKLNGTDRVTIDGRFAGSGRYLTFRNMSAGNSANTVRFIDDASSNTIRSSIIEGCTPSLNGVVFFGTGLTTGNDNNIITDNQIRDRSDAAFVPGSLVGSAGTSAAIANSNNTISNNEIFNFTNTGISISSTGNDSWAVTGNTIYQTAARTSNLTGIDCQSSGTNTISGNTIRDLNTSTFVTGIGVSGFGNTTVSRNRIYSFPSASGSTGFLIGISGNISSGASVTVVNNQITIIPSFTNDQQLWGIFDNGNSGRFNAYYNTVLIGGTGSGTSPTWGYRRSNSAADANTLRNNIFFNNRTGGTGSHFAAGNQTAAGTFSSNYNVFVGTGAIVANFMDFGTSGSGTPVTFAAWQTATGGDANSQASNPGIGDFTTAMFVDPAMGDLHIIPGGNPLVSNTGAPVAVITTDYDNDTRSALTPWIGSDEIVTNTAPTITTTGFSPLSRQQGTAASNATIATVSDNESAAGALSVTATTVPAGISITNIVNTNGTITADVAADCSAASGNNIVVLQASDGSLTTTASLTVNVTANAAPTLSYADATVAFNASTSNSPTTASDNGSIAGYTVQSPGTYTGTISVDSSGVVSVTNAAPFGSHTITIRATDNCGSTTDATFTLNVTDNVAPETTIDTKPNDPSNSADATFTFSGTDNESGVASFECKLDTAAFAACISPANYLSLNDGSHTFEVRAIDHAGNVDITPASYTWIIDTNTAPTITAATGLVRQQGTATSNSTIATVSDNETAVDGLTVTATTVPAGISISKIINTSGTITADVAADCSAATGDNTIVLEVSDGSLTTTDNLTVNVTANTAPTLTYDNISVGLNASTTNSPTAASDNGSITSFVVQDQGTSTGTISVDASGLVLIIDAGPAGTHPITIRATDNCGATTDSTFTLSVTDLPNFCTSATANGNWSAPATWACGHLPTANDVVTIQSGHTVTLDVDPVDVSITVNAGAY